MWKITNITSKMTSLKQDDLLTKETFTSNSLHLSYENKNYWKPYNISSSSELSFLDEKRYNLPIGNIEHSTPSKKKKKAKSDTEALLAVKDFELPKIKENTINPLFSSFVPSKEHKSDEISEMSNDCSPLSMDTMTGQLQVMDIQTSPFNLNSVNALKTSNIFYNLHSSSQLPFNDNNKHAHNKKNFTNLVNDSANLFDDPIYNKEAKNTGFYRLSVLERTTESFLSNNTSRILFDELEKLSESHEDETNINKFMKKEQHRYEYLNKEMSGTDLELQNINHFIKNEEKQQRREKLQKRADRLKDIFKLKSSTYVLSKHSLLDLRDRNVLQSQFERTKDNIELANNLSGEFDITIGSGISEFSSSYPQTNLYPPSEFNAFHEILDPESNALEVEHAKTNSLNEILQQEFSPINEEAFVAQEKTFEQKLKSLKRAGSKKWALILSNVNNGKTQSRDIQPETGISVNTTVKNFEKQELNVLKSSFAAGVETDILRKVENEADPSINKESKQIPPKYAPLYQKNSKISKKNLLAEGQKYYSPLKGSESPSSHHRLGKKWWIFGSLGGRKHDRVDNGLDASLINDVDSLVISNYVEGNSESSGEKVLDLSKNEDSLFRRLTRNFTKKSMSQPRKKSMSVSFVKYTTNIYKSQNEGLEPVTVASEFKAKPILKR